MTKSLAYQKAQEFLSLSPEEKHAIDNDPRYDGLFQIIQEMSDSVERLNHDPSIRYVGECHICNKS